MTSDICHVLEAEYALRMNGLEEKGYLLSGEVIPGSVSMRHGLSCSEDGNSLRITRM
jgi:hypothetical protein